MNSRIRKKEMEKKLADYEVQKHQMSIFDFSELAEQNKYSNTIDLYDIMPKYFRGKQKITTERVPLIRKFAFDNIKYTLKLFPATIEYKDKKTKEVKYRSYFPSNREEIVEDALRKIAATGQGAFLDDEASVIFTLYQLYEELKKMGHNYSFNQIKEALNILVDTKIELISEDGLTSMTSHLFETIGIKHLDKKNKNINAFVRFNPLVTKAIKNKNFKQLNYQKSMSFKKGVARWLHKRLSQKYRQASLKENYNIKLSTIISGYGAEQYNKISNNNRKIVEGLEELKKGKIIRKYDIEKIPDPIRKNKILDFKYILYADIEFIAEMKKSNKRTKNILLFDKNTLKDIEEIDSFESTF